VFFHGFTMSGPSVFEIGVACQTDVGLVRSANQDSFLVVEPSDPRMLATRGRLVIVADGMGGHAGGETASAIVVETVATTYMNGTNPNLSGALAHAVEEANRAVHAESIRNPALHKMGSTCTALVVHNGLAYLAHVGDSRCYLIRDGQIRQMTMGPFQSGSAGGQWLDHGGAGGNPPGKECNSQLHGTEA
jgi:PPM family protein phosphatase